MNVLIVYAHQEPKSFNGAMLATAVTTLAEQGHKVQVSDLYAMKFKAVADAADFQKQTDPAFFKYQIEQGNAYANKTLAADIAAEQEKLLWCNLLIMQFPLWWFSLPAIMKGWVDRVFTTGFAFGHGKWYDAGGLRGRKAMLALTTGGPQNMYAKGGINGDIDDVLHNINHGILCFVGFEVLPPFVAWAPAHVEQPNREDYLQAYRQRLLNLENTTPIRYPRLADYDENFRLKRG